MVNREKNPDAIIGASIYAKNLGKGPWEYSIKWRDEGSEMWTGEFPTWQEAIEALWDQLQVLEDAS